MEEQELNLREKTLIRLIIKANLSKRQRLENAAVLKETEHVLKGHNMN